MIGPFHGRLVRSRPRWSSERWLGPAGRSNGSIQSQAFAAGQVGRWCYKGLKDPLSGREAEHSTGCARAWCRSVRGGNAVLGGLGAEQAALVGIVVAAEDL